MFLYLWRAALAASLTSPALPALEQALCPVFTRISREALNRGLQGIEGDFYEVDATLRITQMIKVMLINH